MAHGAAAVEPLLEVQGDGGGGHLDEVGGAGHGGLGAARAGDHHVRSLASSDTKNAAENDLILFSILKVNYLLQ